MISIGVVREAVLSDQPWSRLDKIVRAEMDAGRKVDSIAEDFVGIRSEVWETPGIGEDGEDAFGDTLDALTGNCSPKCRYTDPPNMSLPNQEEILSLPKIARVAFVARCAKRILLLTSGSWTNDDGQFFKAMWQCVHYAEKVAQFSERRPEYEPIETGEEAYKRIWNRSDQHVFGTSSILSAVTFAQEFDSPNHQDEALRAAYDSVVAAREFADITLFIRRDFDRLAALAAWQKWIDDTPVPPTVFGPLWPEGPPAGWPADPELPQRKDVAFELAAKEGATSTIIEDEVVNLFNTINRYYIARGGKPLDLEDFQPFVSVLQSVEV